MSDSDLVLKPGNIIKPIIDNEESKILVKKLYGLRCSAISELNGYDDKNFKILVDESERPENVPKICSNGYVLKIMNSLDSKGLSFIDAQNSLMLYLGNRNINCPKPIKNVEGKYYSMEKLNSGGEHIVRLLEFVTGSVLLDCPLSSNLFVEVGKFVANFDLKLQKFNHPAYDSRSFLWALDSVPKILEFLFAVKSTERRKLIEEVIDQFQKRVLSIKSNLETGIIHGDFNEQNIIVDRVNNDWHITGVLDFGDSHRSCYLFELAIVMTYMIIVAKDLSAGGYVLGGYSTIRIPTEEEVSLLKVCVAARMCQSLVMGAYTILQDPENKYILTTAAAGWELLITLWNEPEEQLLKHWKLIASGCK